ncbi:MAG: hypothetical protein ACKVVP_03225 [Chloroflexota bacterium]
MTMRSDEQPLSTADIARGSTTTDSRRREDEAEGPSHEERWIEPDPPQRVTESTSPTEPPTAGIPAGQGQADGAEALFASDDANAFHGRWTEVQAGFVDDPRHAVEQADGLVAEVIKNLAQAFADERSGLEQQWQKGEDVSTEELRLALRRYRSFFDRLLSV